MSVDLFWLISGLVTLYYGSEALVRGASSLALAMHIRPVIVGLTVVALATSAPELLVSLVAAANGSGGVSVGNIIGSNVCNIALVLGLSALFRPLPIQTRILSREMPFMVGTTILFFVLSIDGRIARWEGIILLSGLVVFLFYGIATSRNGEAPSDLPSGPEKHQVQTYVKNTFLCIFGLFALMLGARWVVQSAITIATAFGFSEFFIGLTVVALGTSLPELATSVVAGIRNEADISIGNVVGSNIFNICLVMGAVGLFSPLNIDPELIYFEFPAMVGISILILVLGLIYRKINRAHGLGLIGIFFAYMASSYFLGP